MNQLLYLINALESPWCLAHIVQSTVAAVIALAIAYALRNRSPWLRHTILAVAMLKFLVFIPITMTVPTSLGWLATASEKEPTERIGPSGPSRADYVSNPASTRSNSMHDGVAIAVETERVNARSRIEDSHRGTTLASSRKTIAAERFKPSTLLLTVVVVYLVGVLYLCARVLRNWRRVQAIIRSARPAGGLMGCVCENLSDKCGLKKTPRLLVAQGLRTPFATGLIRPTIVLPDWVVNHLDEAEQRCIVAHEMNHLRRLDPWIEWLQSLISVLWWPHPCIWILSFELRRAREECCDDAVIAQEIEEPAQYAQMLISAARFARLFQSKQDWIPRTAIFGESPLAQRVRRAIATQSLRRPTRASLLLQLCVVVAILPTIQITLAQEQLVPLSVPAESPAEPSSPTTIAGQVVDESGEPVANAKVVTYPVLRSLGEKQAMTDANGEFAIEVSDFPAGFRPRVSAAVYKPGYAVAAFGSLKRPIRIVLKRPQSLDVRVKSPDGQPLPSAKVMLGYVGFELITAPPPSVIQELSAVVTDEDGVANVPIPDLKTVRSVVVETEQWGKQQMPLARIPFLVPSNVLNAKLSPVGQLTGQIVDAHGDPAKNLRIRCVSSVSDTPDVQDGESTTDADGRFAMTVPIGRYQVLGDTDAGQFEPIPVKIVEGVNQPIEIQLRPLSVVTGRVLTDTGVPAANLPVSFWRLGDHHREYTNEEGYFSANLAAGNWSYELHPHELYGFLPPHADNPQILEVLEGTAAAVPTQFVETGVIVTGKVEGIDFGEPRIRCLIAHHDGKTYWCEYEDDGSFRLTLPRDVMIDDIERFEIRFVDAPISVLSTQPLVLQPQSTAKPTPTAQEQMKTRMRGLFTATKGERQELVDEFTQYLASAEVMESDIQGAAQIVAFLESVGERQLAEGLCQFALERFSDRSEFASQIEWLKGTASRLTLIGKQLQLTGKIALAGEQLDWSSYQGKLVLVQFWATWCAPCKQDLRVSLELHDKHSLQNFVVLGVSTDQSVSRLQRELNDADFPWTTIHSPVHSEESLSKQFGITQIPFNILVAEDGRVLAVNLRHDELARFVEDHLQPRKKGAPAAITP